MQCSYITTCPGTSIFPYKSIEKCIFLNGRHGIDFGIFRRILSHAYCIQEWYLFMSIQIVSRFRFWYFVRFCATHPSFELLSIYSYNTRILQVCEGKYVESCKSQVQMCMCVNVSRICVDQTAVQIHIGQKFVGFRNSWHLSSILDHFSSIFGGMHQFFQVTGVCGNIAPKLGFFGCILRYITFANVDTHAACPVCAELSFFEIWFWLTFMLSVCNISFGLSCRQRPYFIEYTRSHLNSEVTR